MAPRTPARWDPAQPPAWCRGVCASRVRHELPPWPRCGEVPYRGAHHHRDRAARASGHPRHRPHPHGAESGHHPPQRHHRRPAEASDRERATEGAVPQPDLLAPAPSSSPGTTSVMSAPRPTSSGPLAASAIAAFEATRNRAPGVSWRSSPGKSGGGADRRLEASAKGGPLPVSNAGPSRQGCASPTLHGEGSVGRRRSGSPLRDEQPAVCPSAAAALTHYEPWIAVLERQQHRRRSDGRDQRRSPAGARGSNRPLPSDYLAAW